MIRTPMQRTALAAATALVCSLSLLPLNPVQAAATDISSVPLITSKTAAKPNILFILDNSGSMDSDYMPDDMSNGSTFGFASAQCNGLAYNPSIAYTPPRTADNRAFPSMSLTATWDDGFAPSLSNATTSSTSLALPAGDPYPTAAISVVVSSTSNLSVNDNIALVSSSNTSAWLVGTITAKSGSTITIVPSFSTSNSTYNSWRIGRLSTVSRSGSVYYNYAGTETPLNWTYTGSGVNKGTTFYSQCTASNANGAASPTDASGRPLFSAVTIGTASTDATNYANWYAYYRKRILTMKTAASRSFAALDNYKRVGFTTISDSSVSSSNTFLDVADFDATQKTKFFSDLFLSQPGAYTPLRGALSKAGRYYAKKASNQSYDPVQYACQRNYAVLSTDGYWNTHDESSTYGPYNLSGGNVGQQDATDVRPMYDGATTQVTTTTVLTKRSPQQQVETLKTTTKTWQSVAYTTRNSTACTGSTPYPYRAQPVTRTESIVTKDTVVNDVTLTSTHTVVTNNGVVTSDTTSAYTVQSSTPVSSNLAQAWSDTYGSWANTGTSTTGCSATPYTSTPTYTPVPGTLKSTTGPAITSSTTTDLVTPTTSQGTPNSTTASTGGATDSLADVAEYYYNTDLRTSALGNCTGAAGVDVCNNDVTVADRDNATWQHLTTFTIGLGVNGTLDYDANYLTQTAGTYIDLKNGPLNWPAPSYSSGGGSATNVDDLWHAAVNGRGQYFAASDPDVLSRSLNGVFKKVDAANGAGTSAATSSLQPVQGLDQIFLATYTTQDWTGEIEARNFTLDTVTGTVTTTKAWSAQSGLDALTSATAATRRIYYTRSSTVAGTTTRSLQAFTYANLSADGYTSSLAGFCSQSLQPAQCATMSNVVPNGATLSPLAQANSGTNLVNFLRGDSTYEVSSNATFPLYRDRAHKLGDIVGGSPVFVGMPVFNYGDVGYAAFKTANINRKPMLYVAANDGMVHAFSAKIGDDAGTELWAYVPSMVIPNLYRLADSGYADRHQFFVDSAPVVADVSTTSTANGVSTTTWKTIMVGGLGAGGKGYYALDITDPANPVALWEFTDANLGLSYGPPVITKRADGTWAVVFSSGVNNHTNGGDGNGHLFMLNALTGTKLLDIPTYTSGTVPAGDTGTPSGLVKLNGWVPDVTNNTALRFYGGDLLGNVWRFDTDNLVAPNGGALRLAQLMANSTTPQPITARIELAEVTYNATTYPVIVVGTGRYLGTSDLVNTPQQSIYAIKDPLTSTGWGMVRGNTGIVQQTLTVAGDAASATTNAVDWSTKMGWYVDLANTNERVSVDMGVQYDTLAVITSIPSTDTCSASGVSWLYTFGLSSGSSVLSSGTTVGEKMGNYLGMGLTWVELSDGSSRLLIPASNATLQIKRPNVQASSTNAVPHRTSWRELNN